MRLIVLCLVASGAARADIEVFQAQEVKAVKAQEVKPVQAQPVAPVHGGAQPEMFHAQEVKLEGPAGVDPVAHPVPFDARLAGTYRVSVPGVTFQTEHVDGPNLVRTSHASPGAPAGVLRIGPDGRYSWSKGAGRPATGKLRQVQPRRDAVSGATYWALSDGSHEFYLTASGRDLTLYAPGSNSFALQAVRDQTGR